MTLNPRIVASLAAAPKSADALARELAVADGVIVRQLRRLMADGQVTRSYAKRGAEAIYALATKNMVSLGRISALTSSQAARQVMAVLQRRETVAVFIGPHRDAAVAIGGDPEFDTSLERHRHSLVGMYCISGHGAPTVSRIADDMRARLAELRQAA